MLSPVCPFYRCDTPINKIVPGARVRRRCAMHIDARTAPSLFLYLCRLSLACHSESARAILRARAICPMMTRHCSLCAPSLHYRPLSVTYGSLALFIICHCVPPLRNYSRRYAAIWKKEEGEIENNRRGSNNVRKRVRARKAPSDALRLRPIRNSGT